MPADGEPTPLIVEPGYQFECAFSRDGKWMAYRSAASDRSDVFVCPYPDMNSGRVRAPGDGPKSRPVWSADGNELFFIEDDVKLMEDLGRRGAHPGAWTQG